MKAQDIVNFEHVIEWRNHIHENPELAFKEYETSKYIYNLLESFGGLELSRPTETSVLAVLDTKKPGKSIAFRADIDALPMQEKADVPYKSKVDNVMHSCGHDTHAAMLLGAVEGATKLHAEGKLKGIITFIFQHAEEAPPGGAKELVEAGVLNGIEEIFGLHVAGGFPVGIVASNVGYISAASDRFAITMKGKGSHGSSPEKSIDLITVGAQIVNALQTIVSRNVPALETAVVTVGRFNVGTADNVIADTGTMGGTIRTFNPEIRSLIHERIERIVKGICEANDVEYNVDILIGYGSVKSSPEQLEILESAAKKIDGTMIQHVDPQPGAEDFSAYTDVIPGTFAFIGAGGKFYNHHPEFIVEEKALKIGSSIHLQIIIDQLSK